MALDGDSPLWVWPDPGVHGHELVIECVKYRQGKRHLVELHLVWHSGWDMWRLAKYLEYDDPR